MNRQTIILSLAAAAALTSLSCIHSSSGSERDWKCEVASDTVSYSLAIGCPEDFAALSSQPLDASIPGATSLKIVIDRYEGDKAYFQNSKKYKVHYDFASAHLSTLNGKAAVPNLRQFNETEYYKPDRRFILGALSRYAGPKLWAFELSPYDNASAAMIATAYDKVAKACFCGDSLYFHPTSKAVEDEAEKLPASVKVITSEKLYEGIDYQPLNYGTSMGRLVFTTAKKLETEYIAFRDIVVLDAVPNDISVTSGIITQEFQTPLSHINVLSQNRGTPNMGLKGALANPDLVALKNKWVKLEVDAFAWKITEVTQAEADAWWNDHKPASVGVAKMDTSAKELKDIGDVLNLGKPPLADSLKSRLAAAIKLAIPAYGGKATHFGAFPFMDSTKIKFNKAFAIPVYYYWHHMQRHGLNDTVAALLADPKFQGDPAERDRRLKALRDSIEAKPLDTAFAAMLMAKVRKDLPYPRIRFRSSTNAEDLEGFTGAGLYESKTGGPDDPADHIFDALKKVWAGVWYFRSFEERSYRSIEHNSVGMAVLVHRAHPEEEANGVAITANPYDPAMLEPGFYINVQTGGTEEVVAPGAGIFADQFIYHFDMPGQPVVFIAHSNLIPAGTTVLTNTQINALGTALAEIRRFFQPVYGKDASKWWGMEVDFKLDQPEDDPDADPIILIKQARHYPGFGTK